MNILQNKIEANIPELCDTKTIPSQNYIIPFTNQYYISIDEPMHMQEICKDAVSSTPFTIDTRFLQINPTYFIDNEQFTIHGKQIKQTDAGILIAPRLNVSFNINHNDTHDIIKMILISLVIIIIIIIMCRKKCIDLYQRYVPNPLTQSQPFQRGTRNRSTT